MKQKKRARAVSLVKRAPTVQAQTGLYIRAPRGRHLRDQRVRRLVARMRIAMPWLEDSDLPACRSWAELEILSANAFAELNRRGILNEEGEPRRLLTDFRQLKQAQLAYERELGMTPVARATLKVKSAGEALDIVARFARGDTGRDDEDENQEANADA